MLTCLTFFNDAFEIKYLFLHKALFYRRQATWITSNTNSEYYPRRAEIIRYGVLFAGNGKRFVIVFVEFVCNAKKLWNWLRFFFSYWPMFLNNFFVSSIGLFLLGTLERVSVENLRFIVTRDVWGSWYSMCFSLFMESNIHTIQKKEEKQSDTRNQAGRWSKIHGSKEKKIELMSNNV